MVQTIKIENKVCVMSLEKPSTMTVSNSARIAQISVVASQKHPFTMGKD